VSLEQERDRLQERREEASEEKYAKRKRNRLKGKIGEKRGRGQLEFPKKRCGGRRNFYGLSRIKKNLWEGGKSLHRTK